MAYEKPIKEQERISRQSNLKLILDYMQCRDKCLTMVELIQVSAVMNDYIMNGYSKELVARFEKIEEHIFQNSLNK